MNKTMYEPRPRYVVEIGESVMTIPGRIEFAGWVFHHAFSSMADAQACADGAAEDHQYVRVIDRESTGMDFVKLFAGSNE